MARTSQKPSVEGWLSRKTGLVLMLARAVGRTFSQAFRDTAGPALNPALFSSGKGMEIANEDRRAIRKLLAEQLATEPDRIDRSGNGTDLQESLPEGEEQRLFEQIRRQTAEYNLNNVTRTKAYLAIYEKHPELHWAFLAHMVSRNGGWNMTDLRGNVLSRLMDEEQLEAMFLLLERANALIFQDAYPQLLLYEESRKRGKPLFSLLSRFHVSRFMLPLWQSFWNKGHSPLLTIGLIVNEQQYIQKRVADDRYFREQALQPLTALLQAALQVNQIVFPWFPTDSRRPLLRLRKPEEGTGVDQSPSPASSPPMLYGRILEDFSDLQERIEFGKQLYALLFADPARHSGFLRFARAVPHTGSRADYWPHLFAATAAQQAYPSPESAGTDRLESGALQRGAGSYFSPVLADAWKDRPLGRIERYDWFSDLSAVAYLTTARTDGPVEITREHSAGWRKLELAALARGLASQQR